MRRFCAHMLDRMRNILYPKHVGVHMNDLKKIRLSLKISQIQAANILKISRRTYQKYESLDNQNDEKLIYLIFRLKELTKIDEKTGILTINKIKAIVNDVLKNYNIKSCFLFGSYAKGKATETSDVDLLIDSDITGLDYYGLLEDLKNSLCKNVDLLTTKSVSNNTLILMEIIKDGIKIYG